MVRQALRFRNGIPDDPEERLAAQAPSPKLPMPEGSDPESGCCDKPSQCGSDSTEPVVVQLDET